MEISDLDSAHTFPYLKQNNITPLNPLDSVSIAVEIANLSPWQPLNRHVERLRLCGWPAGRSLRLQWHGQQRVHLQPPVPPGMLTESQPSGNALY